MTLPTLRPHQEQDLNSLREHIRHGRDPLLVAPCGYGKGTVITVIVHRAVKRGKRIIFAVHGKSLVVDMSQRISRLSIEHGVLMGGRARERWHPVQVASIDTLHRMDEPPAADLIIVDECFVRGTMVTMGNGQQLPIERVSVGDWVKNANGVGCVIGCSRTASVKSEQRVKVELSDGKSIECTRYHPFFTDSGWIEAKDLEGHQIFPEEAVRALRRGILSWPEDVVPKMDRADILRKILLEESGESNEEPRSIAEDDANSQRHRAQAINTGRKRPHNGATEICDEEARGRVGDGSFRTDEDAREGQWISNMLQVGSRQQEAKNRHRDRWENTLRKGEVKRCEERLPVGYVRVESVSRIEPGRYATVYNLHVSGHPSYFANGVLVHNCHMALSPTWRKALSRYACRVIGMTATPIRLDKKGLGRKTGGLFDAMVIGPSEQELIKQGNLVGSRVLAPPPPADLGTVKKTAGEFDSKQMAQVCDKTTILGDIVKHWEQHAGGVKTAAFGIDQSHAQHIAESFRSAGYDWAYVDADTKLDERARIWDDLDRGNLRGVSSVGCISIGWDHPVVSCLIAARKTASLGLWRQMLGRGSRPYPGKNKFLVLDHVGNTAFHEPYGCFEDAIPWSLDGEAVSIGTAEKQERYVTCKVPAMVKGVIQYPCYAVFRDGPKECPCCGIPMLKQVAKIQVQEGELQEYKRMENVTYRGSDGQSASLHRMRVFQSLMEDAGMRPGVKNKTAWAVSVFKDRFGSAPPKEWVPGFVAPRSEEALTGEGLEL
jgi:superfamily II DNA or RNA helicase